MSTEKTLSIESGSLEDTQALARSIGSKLKGNETIELLSDLGGGKTTFTKSLAQGASSHDEASSPSFTIQNIYNCPNFQIHHFDFYRLQEAGITGMELAESIEDPQAVCVIEWGNIVDDVLPAGRVRIQITPTSDSSRRFDIKYPPSLSYLLEGYI